MHFNAVSLACLILLIQVHQLYGLFGLYDLNPDIFRNAVNYSLPLRFNDFICFYLHLYTLT